MADTVRLYHGSKSGIVGAIAPISRNKCDFGRGFYMGTEIAQPLTLVCGYPSPHLYTMDLSLEGISVLSLSADVNWAFFVAYNRGALSAANGSALFGHYASLADGADVVVGPIASDCLFVVLDRFFAGQITDAALVACLSALKLGSQYVARTEKACANITVLDDRELGSEERESLAVESRLNRQKGIALADEICRAHRREGLFFDEIVSGGLQ